MVSTLPITTFATLAALVTSAIHTPAQEVSAADFQPRNDAGFMTIKRSFNATQLTVFPGIACNDEEKACALTSAIWHKGRFWVLGREGWCCALSAAVQAKTFIHEWDGDGVYIKTVEVPLPVDPDNELDRGSEPNDTAPEVRDMATDEWRYDSGSGLWVPTGGQAVFMGSEEGIYVTRVDVTGTWHLFDEIQTANGLKTVGNGDFTNPIRGPGLAALRARGTPEFPGLEVSTGTPFTDTANAEGEGYMGVAFDPNGNGGDGSFWVGADDGAGTDGVLRLGDPRGFNDPTDDTSQRVYATGLLGDTRSWNGQIGGNTKPILEIDLMGNILTTLDNGTLITDLNDPMYTHWDPDGTKTPGNAGDDGLLSTGGEWVAGGLELDPLTGTLWVQMNMNQQIFEVDPATGDATGFAQTPFRINPGRTGGITIIPNGDPGTYSSFMDLVAFTNVAGDDFFTIHRGHQYPNFNGLTEPRLLTAVNPKAGPQALTPIRRDNALVYTKNDNIDLFIDETGQGSAAPAKRAEAGFLPAVMLFDINAATNTDATTNFTPFGFPGVLPELRVHSFLSDPDPANAGLAPTFQVPYFLSFSMPTDTVVPFPAPNFVPTGQKIRMQGIYFDSRSQYSALGAMVTNEAWMAGIGLNQVLVELVGDNSFSANVDGFFRIHYLGGPAIEVVKLDFRATTSNFDLLNAWFDADGGALVGYFGVGRGWDPNANGGAGGLLDLPGCDATFRQDSDITTGLVYAAEYNYPAPLDGNNPVAQYVPGSYQFTGFNSAICDYYTEELGFEFRSGMTGTPDTDGATTYEDDLTDVVFQFTDFGDAGDVLRFDADTDGTSPAGAEGHFGMTVTVIFTGGQVVSGDLLLDPQGGRVFIGW